MTVGGLCGAAAGVAAPQGQARRAQGFKGSIQVPLKAIGRNAL